MIWLVWRQHRGELLGATIVLAVLGVLLLLHGIPMYDAYDRDGVRACQRLMFAGPLEGFDDSCFQTVQAFEDEYSDLPEQFGAWLPFLPMLAGMLIGAPLLAREFEQGTWQLVWTQGVTRSRWLATKLALVLGGVAAVSALFAAGVSWWFGPLAPHKFIPEKFNHAVLVFPAYVLVAVAIGTLAGVVFRRTLVAAAITVGGYLAVRLPVEFGLRPHYREPATTADPSVAERGWIIHDAEYGVGPNGEAAPGSTETFRYHPDDRFWQFQVIEAAILLGITLVLLVIAWRLVLGRRGERADRVEERPRVGSASVE
jgi:ABC-type transport system involved in multi-copper enzyme maturation permease subunit